MIIKLPGKVFNYQFSIINFQKRQRGFLLISALLLRLRRNELPDINFRLRQGFSLIELMVVIALFALVVVLASTSYLSFEQSQRLQSAALQLKSDLRSVQASAQAGDKGNGSCPIGATLLGWYFYINNSSTTNTNYTIGGVCVTYNSGTSTYSATAFSQNTINLPQGVTFSGGGYNNCFLPGCSFALTSPSILFTPLNYQAYLFDNTATDGTNFSNFINSTGALNTTCNPTGHLLCMGDTDTLTLTLNGAPYNVRVNQNSGQVSASQT